MSLPSFEELLGSLRLSDDSKPMPSGSATSAAASTIQQPVSRPNFLRGHRRAISDSSSSEFDDDFELEPESPPSRATAFSPTLLGFPSDSDVRLSRHGKRDRYSPYASVSKRVSLPSLNDDACLAARPNRATSTSPLHSVHRVRPLRTSGHVGAGRVSTRSSRSGSQSSWTAPETVPISSFVRRKSPRSASSSPTAPTFPISVREGPLSPVAIPALPILLPNFLATPTTASSNSSFSDAMEYDDIKPPSLFMSHIQITE